MNTHTRNALRLTELGNLLMGHCMSEPMEFWEFEQHMLRLGFTPAQAWIAWTQKECAELAREKSE